MLALVKISLSRRLRVPENSAWQHGVNRERDEHPTFSFVIEAAR